MNPLCLANPKINAHELKLSPSWLMASSQVPWFTAFPGKLVILLPRARSCKEVKEPFCYVWWEVKICPLLANLKGLSNSSWKSVWVSIQNFSLILVDHVVFLGHIYLRTILVTRNALINGSLLVIFCQLTFDTILKKIKWRMPLTAGE